VDAVAGAVAHCGPVRKSGPVTSCAVKFALDSLLEEGVYCELVSESEISEVSIPVRFWAILVS
jgi:hypothetical protein